LVAVRLLLLLLLRLSLLRNWCLRPAFSFLSLSLLL
jgi:hypothetical protein